MLPSTNATYCLAMIGLLMSLPIAANNQAEATAAADNGVSAENGSEANVDQLFHALFDAPTLDYETWVNRYEFIRPSR